jgi:hypothetical protein
MKDEIRIIRVGCKGGGKSEHARNILGMTHDEYEKHGQTIKELLESERRHREFMEEITAQSYLYWIKRLQNEMQLPVAKVPE